MLKCVLHVQHQWPVWDLGGSLPHSSVLKTFHILFRIISTQPQFGGDPRSSYTKLQDHFLGLSSLHSHPTLSKSVGTSFLILQPEIWDFRFPALLCTYYDSICVWGEAMGRQRVGMVGSKNSLLEVFPDSSVSKESACNAGDPSSIPGSGRSSGEGKGYLLQYSDLENSMDWPSILGLPWRLSW